MNETTPSEAEVKQSHLTRFAWVLALLGVLLFGLLVFAPVFGANDILLTTDDGIGATQARKALLPSGWVGAWGDLNLMGQPSLMVCNWTSLWLWLLPATVFVDWIHAIDLWAASGFLLLFLRGKGLSWPAAILGSLTAFWVGTNFTLTYAGHIGKFGILPFAAMYLWLVDRAVKRSSPLLGLLAGGAMGIMFLEQVDVALFYSLVLGPYALFALWQAGGFQVKRWAMVLVPLVGVAFLVALNPLLQGFSLFVDDGETTTETVERSPEEDWEFRTQWSWPPEESISFIAPGYKGWRSGEPEGPYWGRMGRSAGWEVAAPNRGFRNFKLEAVYLGAIPVFLGFWVFLVAWWARRSAPERSREILFWGLVGVVVFLLSCGKYLPFYRIFSLLPAVSSVRNPNKFLQVGQLILALLAAYGLDALAGRSRGAMQAGLSAGVKRGLVIALAVGTGILAIWWLGSMASTDKLVSKLVQEKWGSFAEAIVQRKVAATGHAAMMMLVVSAVVAIESLRRGGPRWVSPVLAWSLVALVAVDAKLLSTHYVKTMDMEPIENNQVVEQVQKHRNHQRVALVKQDGFYNQWLTFDLPYHGVPTFNVTAAPRLHPEYKAFLSALGRDPNRMWLMSGVQLLMGPGQVWGQLQGHSLTKDKYEILYAYNLEPAGKNQVKTVAATQDSPGRECVIRRRGPGLRFCLVDGWDVMAPDEALRTIQDPAFTPFSKVVLSDVPESIQPRAPTQGVVGNVKVESYQSGRIRLKVSCETEAILRIADRYDPGWTATRNGEPVEIIRTDYLFRGIWMPAGVHDVELVFRSSAGLLTVQFLALAFWGGGWLVLAVRRLKGERAGQPEGLSHG